jgi:hypothetical protein
MEGTGKPEYANVDISTKGCTKRNDVAWNLTIGSYRSGTSWETGLWGQQSIVAEMLGGYGWGYCLREYFGLFSKQCRRCLG